MIAVSSSGCDVRSWDSESRIRFWEKKFLEGERALQKHLPAQAVENLDKAVVEAQNLDQEHQGTRLAFTYEQLGNAYLATQNYENAQKNFASALQIYEHLSTESAPNSAHRLIQDGIAGSLTGLGTVAMVQKNFEEAEKILSRALTIYEQLQTDTKDNTGSNIQAQLLCKAELADAYLAENRLDKASLLYRDVIGKIPYCICKKEMQQKAMGNYAKVLRLLGKKHESRNVASDAQKGSAIAKNWEEPFRKATDLTYSRNFESAEKELNEALTVATQFGSQSNEMNLTLRAQSELLYEQGRYNAARSAGEQALAIKQTEIGAEDAEVERDLLMLSKICIAQANWHAASDYIERQYKLQTKSRLPRLPQISENRAYMAFVNEKLGQTNSANACIASAQAAIKQAKKRPRIANSLTILGSIYDSRGDHLKAQDCYQKAIEIVHTNGTDRRVLEPQILLALGNSYAKSTAAGSSDKAKDAYYRALGLLNNQSDPLVATILAHYALIELKAGSKDKAQKLASQAIQSMPKYPDAVHADFNAVMEEFQRLVVKP